MLVTILGRTPLTLAEVSIALVGLGLLGVVVIVIPVGVLAWQGFLFLRAAIRWMTQR